MGACGCTFELGSVILVHSSILFLPWLCASTRDLFNELIQCKRLDHLLAFDLWGPTEDESKSSAIKHACAMAYLCSLFTKQRMCNGISLLIVYQAKNVQ